MDFIYKHPDGGSLWQSGYREIPHNLKIIGIHVVIYAAAECPPLNHHVGAELKYFPNDDAMFPKGIPQYDALLWNAKQAVPTVVEAIKDGKNVLVTCSQGINRSSLVTGLALNQLSSLSSWEVINLIKDKREGTLTNGSFMEMILETDVPNPYLDLMT